MEMANKATLEKWYRSAEAKPSASVGYHYIGCTNEMLKILDHAHEIPHADAEHWRPISSHRAVCQFQFALAKPLSLAQQFRLVTLNAAWKDPNWSPDVAMKSFCDLDFIYFGGYLRSKCRLQWEWNVSKDHAAYYGWTKRDHVVDVPTTRIILNAEQCLKNAKSPEEAKRQTFGTLLHEMIHGRSLPLTETEASRANELIAYNIVRCYGHPRCDRQVDHGPSFQNAAIALHLRIRDDIGFGVTWYNRPKYVWRKHRDGRKGDDFCNPIELDGEDDDFYNPIRPD
jgi:hypothetical protein